MAGRAHTRKRGVRGYRGLPQSAGSGERPRWLWDWVRGGPLTGFGGYAEPASPLGEGEERRRRRKVLDFGLAASARQPPSLQPSPSVQTGHMGRVRADLAARVGWPHGRVPGCAQPGPQASPLGAGEERRPRRKVHDFGLDASPGQPPSPQPSPSRARENKRRLTSGV